MFATVHFYLNNQIDINLIRERAKIKLMTSKLIEKVSPLISTMMPFGILIMHEYAFFSETPNQLLLILLKFFNKGKSSLMKCQSSDGRHCVQLFFFCVVFSLSYDIYMSSCHKMDRNICKQRFDSVSLEKVSRREFNMPQER